jgi:DNA-binding transcriptional regulator GbsR (MarR family)
MHKTAFWRSYVEDWGLLFERSGLPRIAGRIWGWLLICEPAHQSPEELADILKISRGSVSTNARLLEHSGLVEQAAVPGSRRRYIRIRQDPYESLMQQKLDATIQWRELAERGLSVARREETHVPPRLEEMRAFHAFIESEQRALMRRWRDRTRRRRR